MTDSRRRFYASCRRAGALPGTQGLRRRYRAQRGVANNSPEVEPVILRHASDRSDAIRPGLRARLFLRIGLAVGALLACAVPAHADPIFTPILIATTATAEAAGTAIAGISVASALTSITSTSCGHGVTFMGARKCRR